MDCSSCGAEVSAGAQRCPECGATLSQKQDGTETESTQGDSHGTDDTPVQRPGNHQPENQQPENQQHGNQQPGNHQPRNQQPGARQPQNQQPRAQQPGNNRPGGQQPRQAGGTAGPNPQQGGGPNPHQGAPQHQSAQGQQAQGQAGGRAQQERRREQAGESTSLLSDLPIVGGVIYGALSYVISFAFITGFVLLEVEDSDGLGVLPVEDSADALIALFGWFFYSAHNITITGSSGDESVNFVEEAYSAALDPIVPKLAYYVVPAVLLLLFGLLLASRASMEEPVSRLDGARAGATIAVGYLALTVVGAMTVFSYSGTGGVVTIQPDLGSAVLIMGLAYPVAIGGLAGYLAGG